MRKARLSASEPPETIKTDHLSAYKHAVKTVFPESRHVLAKGMKSPVLTTTYRSDYKALTDSGQRRSASR